MSKCIKAQDFKIFNLKLSARAFLPTTLQKGTTVKISHFS